MSVDGMCCWSATLESTNCLTARLNKCFGYLSFKNTVSSRSHSCEKYDQSDDIPLSLSTKYKALRSTEVIL